MQVNAKVEYAMRAMLDLAARPGEQTTVEEIADRQHIPPTILPGIIQTMTKAGLVESSRGYGGGIRLARSPRDISVQTVWEAIQGPLELYRCNSKGPCPLGLGEECPLKSVWEQTQERMLEVWERTSLADLAGGALIAGKSR